jgi:DNA polymerase I-like protein with 3'-5' exonuclease and polymerase domains/uracil-DNA glycosylase
LEFVLKEYFNFPLKSKVLKGKRPRFNLDLPVMTFKEEGEGTRVLVVIDRVPNADIDSGTLFGDSAAGYAIEKLVYDANGNADSPVEEIAFINYHEFRLNGIDAAMAAAAEADFTDRIEKFIKKFKPDVIIAMGREPANSLLDYAGEDSKINPAKTFGRVIKYPNGKKLTGKRVNFLWTLGIFDFCPDIRHETRAEDMKTLQSRASLAGIILRHFEFAFRQKNIHDIPTHGFKPILVDTIKKFDKLVSQLDKGGWVVSIDTETKSLSRVANELISMQFAMERPDSEDHVEKSYFVPFIHPESPWSEKDFEYIKKRLCRFFERGNSHSLVFQNSKFDLTQLASQLGVRFFNHECYGVDNGEYALEENLKFLGDKSLKHLGVSPYRLDQIAIRYGWDAYKGLKVDKSNRTGFNEMKTDDFLMYACTDVVVPLRVRRAQIKRAEYEGYDPKVFETAVTGVLSDMELSFSEIERNGHFIDVKYLNDAMRPNGIIDKLRAENIAKYRKSKAARRANKKLLAAKGAPKKTLFGGGTIGEGGTPWEFSINQVEHQQQLFFSELGIEPLKQRKDGGGSIDKKFLERYGAKDDEGVPLPGYIPEVGWYAEMKKYNTLMTNFINPISRQILVDPDAVKDGRIRSNFNFRYIITGRSGSSQDRERQVGINFQNIPNHGKPAKAVKRVFISPKDFLYIKVDFGAHEVRNWSNISGDDVLADRFKDALKLKRKFMVEVDADKLDKLIGLLKTRGDIHIQNVKFFFDEWVDKKHPMRQKIKAVVFGVMYGKGAFSLAEDIRDSEEAAQALIDKLFGTFRDGGDWIQGTIQKGRSEYIIDSPFGLKRHLWGHYHPDEGVRRAMDRRGPNSNIQGVSSQMGYMASRSLQKLKWDNFTSKGLLFPLQHNNSVHDSLELEDQIRTIPVSLYLIEHAMTTQVARTCRERYGFELKVDLDVEFEIGGTLSDMSTWSQRYDDLSKLVHEKIKWQQDTFGWVTPKAEIKAFEHNIAVMKELRVSEITRDLKEKAHPSETMLINKQVVKELDLKRAA